MNSEQTKPESIIDEALSHHRVISTALDNRPLARWLGERKLSHLRQAHRSCQLVCCQTSFRTSLASCLSPVRKLSDGSIWLILSPLVRVLNSPVNKNLKEITKTLWNKIKNIAPFSVKTNGLVHGVIWSFFTWLLLSNWFWRIYLFIFFQHNYLSTFKSKKY